MSPGPDLEPWDEFAVALVGAGAVLAGFVFVALSINLDRILASRELPARAAETLVVFAGTILPCALLLVPDQGRPALGAELVVVGAAEAVLLGVLLPRGNRPGQPALWTLTRAVTAAVVSLPVVLAGLCVLLEQDGGLHLIAVAVLLAVVAGIGNTWVLVVEVVRDERYGAEQG